MKIQKKKLNEKIEDIESRMKRYENDKKEKKEEANNNFKKKNPESNNFEDSEEYKDYLKQIEYIQKTN